MLSALSSDMPLSAGVDILSHLLCERLHRHRHGSIVRSLHKACSLSASVDRAEVPPFVPFVAQSIVATKNSLCFCKTGLTMLGLYESLCIHLSCLRVLCETVSTD